MRLVADRRPATDEQLAVEGLRTLHRISEHGGIDRHVAPAHNLQALFARRLPPDALHVLAVDGLARHEQLGHAIMPRFGKLEAQAFCFIGKEGMRDLQQEAGAVTRLGVGAHGAAMLEVLEDGQAIGHHAVAFHIVYVGDEADAAGIVLVARVIKTMRLRKTFWPVLNVHGQLLASSSSHPPAGAVMGPVDLLRILRRCRSLEGGAFGWRRTRQGDRTPGHLSPGRSPSVAFAERSAGQPSGIAGRFGRRFQGLGGRIPDHPGSTCLEIAAKGQCHCPISV